MAITRVRYRERQRLVAADMRVEQDYRLALGGRHHLSVHDWGVVRGLRVLAGQTPGLWTLSSGVAIDGYGRELLVPQASAIDLSGVAEDNWQYLVLYYCEDPQQVPPGKRCADDPAPRIRSRTQITLLSEYFPPDAMPADLDRARAAGARPDDPSWPVLVARLRGGAAAAGAAAPNPAYDQTRYVAHRAGRLWAPTGRARLRLGPESSTDLYQALLSTGDSACKLTARVAIDRDATVHVWRPLSIVGPNAAASLALADDLALRIRAPMPAGFRRRLRVNGVLDWTRATFSASLLDLGNPLARPLTVERDDLGVGQKSLLLQFGNIGRARLGMVDRKTGDPIAFSDLQTPARLRTHGRARLPNPIAFDLTLNPGGAALSLSALEQASVAAASPCDGIARTRGDPGPAGTPTLQFLPAATLTPDPLMREVHAVVTSKPTDPVLATELRINGGAEDDTDGSTRVSIGSSRTGKPYHPGLAMDGGGRLRVRAGNVGTADPQPLDVRGSVHLAPIGKNDPLMPELMALAYLGGLRLMGRIDSANKATVVAPGTVARGTELKYNIAPLGVAATAGMRRCVELISTCSDGSGDLSFRSLDDVVANPTAPPPQTIPNYSPSAGTVYLRVLLLMNQGSAARVSVSDSHQISVT